MMAFVTVPFGLRQCNDGLGIGLRRGFQVERKVRPLWNVQKKLRVYCTGVEEGVIGIPGSLNEAAQQAISASEQAFQTTKRVFVEVDISGGDVTYTLLKNSVPFVKLLPPLFATAQTYVVFPDAGAAALVKRDWECPSNWVICGLEQVEIEPETEGVIIVSPRASEVDLLVDVVERVGDLPVVIVNPDLVDMGVTGLSLNARRLRERVIDTFSTAYYLRTFEWGVLLRAFPGNWGVWVDDPGSQVGFRLVAELEERPGVETIDKVLRNDGRDESASGGVFGGLKRFLSTYMKG